MNLLCTLLCPDFTDVLPIVAMAFIVVVITMFLISPAATVVGILMGGEQTGLMWQVLTFGAYGPIKIKLAWPRFDLLLKLAFPQIAIKTPSMIYLALVRSARTAPHSAYIFWPTFIAYVFWPMQQTDLQQPYSRP